MLLIPTRNALNYVHASKLFCNESNLDMGTTPPRLLRKRNLIVKSSHDVVLISKGAERTLNGRMYKRRSIWAYNHSLDVR